MIMSVSTLDKVEDSLRMKEMKQNDSRSQETNLHSVAM